MNIELFYDLLLDQLPLQVGYHARVVVVDGLGLALLVGSEQPAFEECVGQFEVAYNFFDGSTRIEREAVVALGNQLVGNHLADFGQVLFLGLHGILTEDTVEELLIQLGGLQVGNICHCHFEVGCHIGSLLLVGIEHRSQFGYRSVAALRGVEYHFVALLHAGKLGLLVVALEVVGRNDCALYRDAAFEGSAVARELDHRTLDEVFLVGRLVYRNLFAEAGTERFVLTFYHIVVDRNRVVGNRNRLVYLHIQFGGQSHIKTEGEIVLSIQVDRHVFGRHGLAQNVEFVIADIIVQSL